MVLRSPWKLMPITLVLVLGVAIMTFRAIGATSEVITFVAWHPDGTLLAVGNQNTVQILDTATMQVLNVFSDLERQKTAPAWSPDGDRLAIANGPRLDIWQYPWDPDAAELVLSYSSPDWRWLYALAWSPNGDKIAVGDVAVLEVWDLSDVHLQLSMSSKEPGDDITDLVWSPSGTLLANTSLDHRVLIWDVATGDLLSTLIVSNDPVTSFTSEIDVVTLEAAWSPDETRLVIACEDGTVRLWDRTAISEPETISYPYTSLYRHQDAVWSVDWSPDGRWIASGGADGTVRLWDVYQGEEVDVIWVGGIIGSVAWSPDSTRLAYGGEGGIPQIVSPPISTPTPTPTETPTPTPTFTPTPTETPTFTPTPDPVIFFDDFESGGGNWTATGRWALNSQSPYSGSWAFANIRNTYNSYTDTLTLNVPLDLAGTTSPQLTYWTRYQFGSNGDAMRVQVSSNNGQTWTTVQTLSSGNSNWVRKKINLSTYAGQTIRLRFVLSAPSVNGPSSVPNWWIDDVRVTRTPS